MADGFVASKGGDAAEVAGLPVGVAGLPVGVAGLLGGIAGLLGGEDELMAPVPVPTASKRYEGIEAPVRGTSTKEPRRVSAVSSWSLS